MNFSEVRKSPEWSERCDSWLDQFTRAERATAELMLDSVSYISYDDVSAGLNDAVQALLSRLNGPCALYPVTNSRRFNEFESYDEYPLGLNGDLGSEGDIGHLCRDISKVVESETFVFPTIKLLKKKRIRHIILLTDTTSTGEQGLEFLNPS